MKELTTPRIVSRYHFTIWAPQTKLDREKLNV